MQFNYYFLKGLSGELRHRLQKARVSEIFSQNKNELMLCFDTSPGIFIIKAHLDGESSLLSFPQHFERARRNSVDLFESLKDLQVTGVRQFKNERSFALMFEGEKSLLFKLHGRHANIVLFERDVPLLLFKNHIEKDRMLSLEALDRSLDQRQDALIHSEFDLPTFFPTFDKNIKQWLTLNGFFDAPSPEFKWTLIEQVLARLNEEKYYLTEINGIPRLMLIEPDTVSEIFDSAITASNALAHRYFSVTGKDRLRASLLVGIRKEIKKSQSYIDQTQQKLTHILERRGYDQLANILMANLHAAKTHAQQEIILFDFYADQSITIKLKPNLSLQQNAELLYRKSKNQAKETSMLQHNIDRKKEHLNTLKQREEEILNAPDFRSLKQLETPKNNATNDLMASPFIHRIIDGYQVFIGKNAKNNDILTQKFAKKDDLWLHARDVSGSHVIIRNPNHVIIPAHTIEKVAQLAAWYSKRKTDSLCPVIYTPKKYVRKPKGSLPGQVILSKEKVVLVRPAKD